MIIKYRLNRLNEINVNEIFPGTDDYEIVNHLDSPQPYLFHSKGSIQFVKNILFLDELYPLGGPALMTPSG